MSIYYRNMKNFLTLRIIQVTIIADKVSIHSLFLDYGAEMARFSIHNDPRIEDWL